MQMWGDLRGLSPGPIWNVKTAPTSRVFTDLSTNTYWAILGQALGLMLRM